MGATEGRRSAGPSTLFSEPCFDFLMFLSFRYVVTTVLVDAFLTRRHKPISSVEILTLVQPTSRYTGELLSSASRTVRRQSSMASLIPVTVRIKIMGTAFRPGLEAPKIEKICDLLVCLAQGPQLHLPRG